MWAMGVLYPLGASRGPWFFNTGARRDVWVHCCLPSETTIQFYGEGLWAGWGDLERHLTMFVAGVGIGGNSFQRDLQFCSGRVRNLWGYLGRWDLEQRQSVHCYGGLCAAACLDGVVWVRFSTWRRLGAGYLWQWGFHHFVVVVTFVVDFVFNQLLHRYAPHFCLVPEVLGARLAIVHLGAWKAQRAPLVGFIVTWRPWGGTRAGGGYLGFFRGSSDWVLVF